MKSARALLLRMVLALFVPTAFFAVTPVSAQTAQVLRDQSIDSAIMGRKLTFNLYRPASTEPLPTLYMLHGYNGGRKDWLGGGNLARTMDRLIADGTIRPMIVVMPDAGNSWYVDNPDRDGAGPIAAALLGDLIPGVEKAMGAIGTRETRAIAGLSMGGYGAIRLAAHHPDMFVSAVSMSGALFPDVPEDKRVPFSEKQIKLFSGAFGTPLEPSRFNAAGVQKPLFSLATMTSPPQFLLMVGDDDYFGLWRGAFAIFTSYRDAGIPIELRVRDGDHTWRQWSSDLPEALKFIDDHFPAR